MSEQTKQYKLLKNINPKHKYQWLFFGIEFMFCFNFQIAGVTMGEVKQVVDMHQRKAKMARHSDAFIALPG